MKKFEYLKVYLSPFKPPKIRFYLGEVKLGTPYFLPRKWVELTEKEKHQEVLKEIVRNNKRGVHVPIELIKKKQSGRLKPVPKKVGWDFVGLGWKWKWDSIRFEWNPLISFVFFGYQFAVMFTPEHPYQFWESWLYYHLQTDKNKSRKERVKQCREEAGQTWTNNEGSTDYYELILKKKYLC